MCGLFGSELLNRNGKRFSCTLVGNTSLLYYRLLNLFGRLVCRVGVRFSMNTLFNHMLIDRNSKRLSRTISDIRNIPSDLILYLFDCCPFSGELSMRCDIRSLISNELVDGGSESPSCSFGRRFVRRLSSRLRSRLSVNGS
ncbi:hypothetical protein SNK05_001223 [Fusarium graminearum]